MCHRTDNGWIVNQIIVEKNKWIVNHIIVDKINWMSVQRSTVQNLLEGNLSCINSVISDCCQQMQTFILANKCRIW